MARPKKTRHGATQPETARTRKQKLLRLHPDTIAALKLMAERWGGSESKLIEDAVLLLAETAMGDAKARELAGRGAHSS